MFSKNINGDWGLGIGDKIKIQIYKIYLFIIYLNMKNTFRKKRTSIIVYIKKFYIFN